MIGDFIPAQNWRFSPDAMWLISPDANNLLIVARHTDVALAGYFFVVQHRRGNQPGAIKKPSAIYTQRAYIKGDRRTGQINALQNM